jgi:hypothetical protein
MDLRDKYKGFSKLDVSETGDSAWINPPSRNSDDAILDILSDYPNLEHILLQSATITDKIAAALIALPKFFSLTLYGTSFNL